jgi:ankyrin repeat protein
MHQKEQEEFNKNFIEAAKKGDLPLVQSLLSKGANIHANNDLALIESFENRNIEVVKYLIEQGADIHIYDDYSLRWASEYGYLDIVQYSIENGANIHARDDDSLKSSSLNNQLEVVNYFLFDCKMKIKKKTKDWLVKNNQHQTLGLIEKRDLLWKLNKNLKKNDSVDKKMKI